VALVAVDNPIPEAKASGFNSMVAAARDLLGPEAWDRVLRRLPPSTAALVQTPPLPVTWIPVAQYGEVVSTVLMHGFGGDEKRMIELGRRSFQADVKTIYRVFIKLMSPQHVIERGTKLWLTYNRNNGLLRTQVTGNRSCDVIYEGVVGVYPGFWSFQRGALMGAVHATGFTQAQVTLVRGGGRSGDAVFTITWGD
jgi:uncharacterized protein (TIGR02265 family)